MVWQVLWNAAQIVLEKFLASGAGENSSIGLADHKGYCCAGDADGD
jgi:hypothetical protein